MDKIKSIANMGRNENSLVFFDLLKAKNFETCKKFIKDKYDIDINYKDKNGETPLLMATRFRNLEMVKLLLENGANADNTNNFGTTPLRIVLDSDIRPKEDDFKFVELLLDYGANVNYNDGYFTPLQEAVQKGNLEVVKLLLDRGANVNEASGKTAFFLGDRKIKKLIIENEEKKWKEMLENKGELEKINYKDKELRNLYKNYKSRALVANVDNLVNHKVGPSLDFNTEHEMSKFLLEELQQDDEEEKKNDDDDDDDDDDDEDNSEQDNDGGGLKKRNNKSKKKKRKRKTIRKKKKSFRKRKSFRK